MKSVAITVDSHKARNCSSEAKFIENSKRSDGILKIDVFVFAAFVLFSCLLSNRSCLHRNSNGLEAFPPFRIGEQASFCCSPSPPP